MNAEEFIAALRKVVAEAAEDGVIATYEHPPGRAPGAQLVELSRWYRDLSSESRAHVRLVARDSADAAVFGFLCTLDGVRAFDTADPKGRLELWYVNGDRRVCLNSLDGQLLHDLWKAV